METEKFEKEIEDYYKEAVEKSKFMKKGILGSFLMKSEVWVIGILQFPLPHYENKNILGMIVHKLTY